MLAVALGAACESSPNTADKQADEAANKKAGEGAKAKVEPPSAAPIKPVGPGTGAADAQSCDVPGMSCFERRRSECKNESSWSFDLAFGTKHFTRVSVAAPGVARLDVAGKTLYGVTGESWLACLTCSAPAGRACLPYLLQVQLSAYETGVAKCDHVIEEGPLWNGLPSKLAIATCSDGQKRRVQFVPALAPVAHALVAAKIIQPKGRLATLDGLPVAADYNGLASFRLGPVEPTGCSVFAYPPTHRVFDDAGDFDAFAKVYADMSKSFEEASAALAESLLHESMSAHGEEMFERTAELCLGKRSSYEEQEVADCYAAHPELQEQAQALMDRFIESAMKGAQVSMADVADLMARHLDQPLCAHFLAE